VPGPEGTFFNVFGIHIASTGPIEQVDVTLAGAWAKYALDPSWLLSPSARYAARR
jgi:hypothetical protein